MQRIYELIIIQSICVVIFICGVLCCKYFFKNTYKQIENWYMDNITVDTDINEVLSDEI